MAGGQIVAEVGEVVAAVVFFVDHVGMGDNGQERKSSVANIQPVDRFFFIRGPLASLQEVLLQTLKNRLFGFKDEDLCMKMGNSCWRGDGEENLIEWRV